MTDVARARETLDAVVAAFGQERVLVPALLGLRVPGKDSAS